LTQYGPVIKLISMFRGHSWIRRAAVAIVLLASLGASPIVLPHVDARDADCRPAAPHDAEAHAFAAAPDRAPRDSEHCFLCHSLRTFYPAFETFEHHYFGPRTERLHTAPVDRALIVAWTLIPGRAPPV
jgi:hypothetical protein